MLVLLVMFIGIVMIVGTIVNFRKGLLILGKPKEELKDGEIGDAFEYLFVFVGFIIFISVVYF